MTVDATEIIEDADAQTDRWREYARPAAEWFHDHEGELFERDEAIENLKDELDVSTSVTQEAVSNLVSDIVDPVVQIPLNGSRYVGIVEFYEFDGAYGYVHFDDNRGRERRVVCAQCVHEAEHDSEVAHATAGDPHGTFEEGADYDTLLEAVHDHYEIHDKKPENVETGATLASGTTIGGNTSFHEGNINTASVTSLGTGNMLPGEFLQNSSGFLTGGIPPRSIYGSGVSGDITRSSNTQENDIVLADTYNVNSGVTVTSSNQTLVIVANSKITIDGTIRTTGNGANGGGGGGGTSSVTPQSGSGGADSETGGDGGNGGDGQGSGAGGGQSTYSQQRRDLLTYTFANEFFDFLNSQILAGAGGGGGGAAVRDDETGNSGGDGGDGGGGIILSAPQIEINGLVDASGQDGQDAISNPDGGAAGGGGGGGGGSVLAITSNITGESNISVSGGFGGSGLSGGGNGSSGANGEIYIVD